MGTELSPHFFVSPGDPTMFRTSLARFAGPLRRAAEAEAAATTKLNFSLLLPQESIYQEALVEQVTIPASTGEMGVLKDHQQTIQDLAAGLLTVKVDATTETRYFVTGGFAFVHSDKTIVAPTDAFPVEDLDATAVSKGLADATAALASASTEEEKDAARVAVDVHRAMEYALSK